MFLRVCSGTEYIVLVSLGTVQYSTVMSSVKPSRRIARTKAKKLQLQEDEEEREHDKVSDKLTKRLAKLSLTQLLNSKNTLPAQETLEIFKQWISKHEDLQALHDVIQDVKSDLFDRNYTKAFDSNLKREAYCIRWSSSRSLAYSTFLSSQPDILDLLQNEPDLKLLSIGGGAGAELIAFGSIYSRLLELQELSDDTARNWDLQAVDISNWCSIVDDIDSYIQDRWVKSNDFRKVHDLNISFDEYDILNIGKNTENDDDDVVVDLQDMDLITCCFTTNELFAEDKAASIRFLKKLSQDCKPGCLFLILESAGSFSNVQVGTKQFPIHFLIDTILCGKPDSHGVTDGDWEIVDQNDSIWYRVPSDVEYNLKLENMRFFYRVYRKN
ncbi:hypothetical protein CANARDRAFT_30020 [[Candida] arabinofermentans NRRL YB-2248]|uniref:25S rRNA (Uridine(2843)-N(3))-methyltransferase n=1 Tax=[Candida] arabinofermentans NRRL YB-2248 TaxID=983967 RepID=A0A1E4SVC3_9ASCO|nr:hypothetical protein CANARDRAFT_30020 [[Candida] arabinofermentans NRRL YB-2248]